MTENKKDSESSAHWISPDKRLFDKASWLTILAGIVLYIVGIVVSLLYQSGNPPEITHIICNGANGACKKAAQDAASQAALKSGLDFPFLIAEALKAVGLTIVAAVSISSTVDHRTRTYFFSQLSNRMRRLGSNVISGMFETNQPERLFELIKQDILEKKVVRKNIDINYTLSDLKFDNGRLRGRRFVKVDVIILTVNENVSSSTACNNGIVEMPVGLALPNPMYDELKQHVRINSFRIGSETLSKEDLVELNTTLQKNLEDDNAVDAKVSIRKCRIPFKGSVTVSGSYTMVKELEDTEVFRTAEIAESISLTVTDKTDINLVVRARSMSHGELHYQGSPSSKQWKLDDLSLPLQGIMVWWKHPLTPNNDHQSDDL